MKKIITIFLIGILFCIAVFNIIKNNKTDITEIHIGYQSVTSQTWGALIIKDQKLLEKNLKNKYPNKKFKVVWHDEISGAVINTNMITGKMQFGFMGDMPLILNMYKSATLEKYESKLIAFDGKGENGANQSIMVSNNSDIKSLKDLKSKTISTPIGSSAHFMLMKVLQKENMLNDVEIVHQDVALASQLLSTNKTDAFSIWAPYPNFLSTKEIGKILIDGKETEIDYLAGIVVDNNWAIKNKKIVDVFLETLNEAHEFIKSNPKKTAKIFSKQSGFDYDITLKEVKNIKWESNISDKDILTLKEKQDFLISLNQIQKFDLEKYIK